MIDRALRGVTGLLASALPPGLLFPVVRKLLRSRARVLAPERRMRELLVMQNFLANELAEAGQALGGGSHVKHGLMGYHEFFAQRIAAGDCVLDVGCGGGELAATIARATGASVLAADCDAGCVARARHNCIGLPVEVVLADVLAWQPPQDVSVLVLSNVLEHLPERAAFLQRLFHSSGARRALVRVPMYERDWTVPMREQMGIEWRLDITHETEYRLPQFEAEVCAAGCRVEEMQIRWCEIWAVLVPDAGLQPGSAV